MVRTKIEDLSSEKEVLLIAEVKSILLMSALNGQWMT